MVRSTVATINLGAVKGQSGLQIGGRVRVHGTGRLAGSTATIEKVLTGGIPQVIVRTDDGQSGRVRSIDVEPPPQGTPPSADGDPPTGGVEA